MTLEEMARIIIQRAKSPTPDVVMKAASVAELAKGYLEAKGTADRRQGTIDRLTKRRDALAWQLNETLSALREIHPEHDIEDDCETCYIWTEGVDVLRG